MKVYQAIKELVQMSILLKLMEQEDEVYATNQILSLLGLIDFPQEQEGILETSGLEIPDLLDELVEYAVHEGIIADLFDEKEILSSKIMNIFISKPSEINQTFYEKYHVNPEQATQYFYDLSRNSNYIQTKRISRNINYKTETLYGDLDITINLSKPEKDPKQIELEKTRKKFFYQYPKCLLCAENEGYAGRTGHPARSNHRVIRLDLSGEPWLFQYSPYVYYNEHCIILSHEHRDMVINQKTFQRLIEFVEKFPHYFIGSNADLPIVGGSILSHDHYQGGSYEFPMARAANEWTFKLDSFPDVSAFTVKWPLSVIRLRSSNREELIQACGYILEKWRKYTDIGADIIANTGNIKHNTITPIVRMHKDELEVDLVLRNNRTNEEHPYGIFHPHQDVHHIKKENIGLIEVMGLAVLPSRLENELLEVENYLLGKPNQIETYHLQWADKIRSNYQATLTNEAVHKVVQNEVGCKFLKALLDCGVFKRDEEGQKAFHRCILSLSNQ